MANEVVAIIMAWTAIAWVVSTNQHYTAQDNQPSVLHEENVGHYTANNIISADISQRPCPGVPECICTNNTGGVTGVEVNCSHRKLTAIPNGLPNNTVRLELQENNIKNIQPNIFKHFHILQFLNLSKNTIRILTKDNFDGLAGLTNLSITHNELIKIENGSFSSLHNLMDLDLTGNRYLKFKSLPNVTYDLQFTSIKTMNLTHIHTIFGDCTHLCDHELQYINRTKIEILILDTNRLESLCFTAVRYIPKTLKYLSLRDNRLGIGLYIHFLLNPHVLENLEYLIVSEQSKSHILNSFNVDEMDNNHATHATAEHLTGSNTVQEANYSLQLHDESVIPSQYSLKKQHVNETNDFYTVSKMKPGLLALGIPFTTCCTSCYPCKQKIALQVPKKLKYLDASDRHARMRISRLCLCTPNVLTTVKLNKNMYYTWKRTWLGGLNITSLDLSENGCSIVTQTFFHNLTNLKVLNLSTNFLGFSLKKDINGITFQEQNKLEVLDLSDNKIVKLPSLIFTGLKSLKNLSLANNLLSHFTIDLEQMSKLQVIKVQGNMLSEISINARKQLDHLASSHPVTVNMSGNPFQCTCATLDFVLWVSETRVNFDDVDQYTCRFANGTMEQLVKAKNIYSMLIKKCANYTTLIIIVCAVLIFCISIVVGAILYRYRWNLRYIYYSAKFRMKGYTALNNDDNGFNFDVFVSYCDTAGNFIRQQVIPELEDKRGIHLLIHERDFRAGLFVADNIMQAITTSRKMLIVLTQDYINSTWCKYELNMARMETIKTGRDVICVLMKEEMEASSLPLELMDVIQQQTYLELPTDPDHLEQFWDRLKSALADS